MAAAHRFTTAVQNHVETTDMYDNAESLSTSLHAYDDKTHNKESQDESDWEQNYYIYILLLWIFFG